MHIGMLTLRRTALLAGAAAGLLSGCQTAGSQFANPGVARGDGSTATVVTSPAFAQVAAGQNLVPVSHPTVMPGRIPMSAAGQPQMMLSSVPTFTGQPMVVGPAVMGSGGLVYPVAYVPAGSQPMMTTQVMSSSAGTVATSQPVMMSSVPVMPAAGTAGQPTLSVVHGPNGLQYVITEVVGPAPPASAATAAPAALPQPAPASVAPAPEAVAPAPAIEFPAEPPTFRAPPPTSIPLPPIPPAPTPLPATGPPEAAAPMAPAPLPPAVGAKPPTGAVLPASNVSGPSLGSFPPVPTVTLPPAPAAAKLPPATGVADDDIPPAPVFVPVPR